LHCIYTCLFSDFVCVCILGLNRAVILHATLKLVPILQQMRNGLQLYGLSDLMSKYPKICHFAVMFSVKGSYKEQREVTLMNHLQDLLQELEQNENPPGLQEAALPSMTPRTFLQWVTGQGHVPILAWEKAKFRIIVEFNHYCDVDYSEHTICYPTVAACSSTITLPVKHMLTYENFKQIMMEAFCLGQEFHKI
uniref:HECT domain-containing protein n=1 Tax=Pygocentrus nattereri TaxID=42514 RepID=A0AAR2KAU7_PYGNA